MSQKLSENTDFNSCYETYKNLVFRTALSYSGDDYYLAEEASQHTFLQLYINFDYMTDDNVESWLITTVKNYVLNYQKKAGWEIADENIVETHDSYDAACSTEEKVFTERRNQEHKLLKENIFEQLNEKNPRWYDAVVKAYILEKPQKEIAEDMNIEIGVLHQVLHRARTWIKKNYRESFDEIKRK